MPRRCARSWQTNSAKPASLDPGSIARYRKEAAEAPHRANRRNLLKEEKRRAEVEARGRAEVAVRSHAQPVILYSPVSR